MGVAVVAVDGFAAGVEVGAPAAVAAAAVVVVVVAAVAVAAVAVADVAVTAVAEVEVAEEQSSSSGLVVLERHQACSLAGDRAFFGQAPLRCLYIHE